MPGIASLCIPALGEEDGPAGVADGLSGVTQLPAGVGVAATFDPSLARQYGQVIGSEEFGKGAAVNLGPTINIDRDPRWGRSFEAFTEDPFLNASLATSEIDGVQSTGEMSQVKHFAAYNQETNRNTQADDVIVDQRTLNEIYFPAFQAAVQQSKAGSVMCSYSMINGDYACQSPFLMNQTLDQEWGYPGFVTSDYGALHDTMGGALAGLDQEQPFNTFFGTPLEDAVNNGTIPRAVLNTMVQRIFTEMFRFNLFNNPPTGTPSSTVTTAAHQAVGTNVADTAATLLKNSSHTLPLSANHAGTVAVIGPAASTQPIYGGGGSAYVNASSASATVTPLAGLQAAAGSGTNIDYEPGLPTDTSLTAIPHRRSDPGVRADVVRAGLHRDADRPGDGHVRARDHQPVRLLHAGVPVAGRQAADRQSEHAAGEHVLGGGSPDRGSAIHAGDPAGRLQASALTWATPSDLAPGDRAGGRGRQVGIERGRGRLRRHRVRGHRSPQPQPALGAGRADLTRSRRPTHTPRS